jgi:hypothetical protein
MGQACPEPAEVACAAAGCGNAANAMTPIATLTRCLNFMLAPSGKETSM